ncbi:MAG TPA: PEGA domain-containing protein [Methanocorpusculum sp.]|nr:PEGA domain-containing protein [Methanocorpusculum sp.]
MKKTAIALIAGIVLLGLFIFPSVAAADVDDDYDWDEIEDAIGAGLLAAALSYDYDPTPTPYYVYETVYEPVYVSSYSPSYGYLYVNSSPDGCSLYVDGRYQGKTPISVTLETGRHSVSLAKSGYDEYNTTVGINTGSETTLYPTLYKKVSEGYLSVNSNPSGADVYIDNCYRGTTPLTLYLSSGTYDVLIKKPDYKPYSSTVSVKDGKTSTLSANLQSDNSYGYVTVITVPGGAAVYVDGAYFGTTPINGGGVTLGPYTSATTHTVMVSADGYASQSQTFSVSSGQTKTMQFALEKDQNAKGSVAVSSSPSGAYIYIDNLFYGMTPVTIPGLEKGSHILKLSAAGYNDYQDTFTLNPGESVQKSVAMSPASSPVPTSTPLPAAGLLAGLLAAGVLFTLKRK